MLTVVISSYSNIYSKSKLNKSENIGVIPAY